MAGQVIGLILSMEGWAWRGGHLMTSRYLHAIKYGRYSSISIYRGTWPYSHVRI